MSRPAGDPLQKITLNIYLTDYLFYKDRYGGYQERIRDLVSRDVKMTMRTDRMIEEETADE